MFWFFFIIALIEAGTTKSECPPTTASIQQLLDDAYIPGAAIIVVNANEIIYQQGVGYHSPPISEELQPIDPSSSIFILASISKTFIAVAAMQMVESNLLNLDTDINQYLPPLMKIVHPYLPNTTITTRHLLSHTSGIGPNLIEELQHYLPGDSFTQTNLGDVIQKYLSNNASWLPVPPGNITFYSNVAAALAAFIIERLAGMPYEKYVQDKILKPLGIDEKKASYRLSNFQDNRKSLVGHYIYNASWLETYQQMAPTLNISLVSFKHHPSKQ
jgi:CubicO group peptidase (beta-lactamase class C family)